MMVPNRSSNSVVAMAMEFHTVDFESIASNESIFLLKLVSLLYLL